MSAMKIVRDKATDLEKLRDEVAELNQIVGALLLGLTLAESFPQEAAAGALVDLAQCHQRTVAIGA